MEIAVLELPNLAKPDAEMQLTEANMPTIARNEPTKPVLESQYRPNKVVKY